MAGVPASPCRSALVATTSTRASHACGQVPQWIWRDSGAPLEFVLILVLGALALGCWIQLYMTGDRDAGS